MIKRDSEIYFTCAIIIEYQEEHEITCVLRVLDLRRFRICMGHMWRHIERLIYQANKLEQ